MSPTDPPHSPGEGFKRCTGDWNESHGWARERGDGYSDVRWNDGFWVVIETKHLIFLDEKFEPIT